MSRYLLDVNTILALLDPRHVFHEAAHAWLGSQPMSVRLLTCPLTENGVIRVASQSKYPNHLGTASDVREVMQAFCADSRHEFCPDDVSLLDEKTLAHPELLTPSRVTDIYLLALAIKHNARMATFDNRIPADAILHGKKSLNVISA
ncbi:MAG TPA: PIN domain-containing protein [Thermoflexales bacterium]|nr:PIN domain-containing protein [Thermoflexales bacterium]HQW36808.1 PIN domain-containing protein [Thermoflexales bacterium]HQZ21024.1 PIN domain-containing protein [Thermoflexales bacterium]HRA01594.1 PIN domain-containing protein [Thermoflexales bacterium]